MQPENRSIPSLNKAKMPAPFTGHAGTLAQGSKPPSSQSLTAKMTDYRSWWNLPRPRPKKPA